MTEECPEPTTPGKMNEMLAEGWSSRFVASGPRLQEGIDNYRSLGFDVTTVLFRELGCGECTICFEDDNEDAAMIFTRKTPTDSSERSEPPEPSESADPPESPEPTDSSEPVEDSQ